MAVSDVAVFPEQLVEDRKSGRVRELGAFMKPYLEKLKQLQAEVFGPEDGRGAGRDRGEGCLG